MFTPQSRLDYLASLNQSQIDEGIRNGEIQDFELADLADYLGLNLPPQSGATTLPGVTVTATALPGWKVWAAVAIVAMIVLSDARGR